MSHVYIVRFDVDLLKVGRANKPDLRIGNHRSDARLFGADVRRAWVSPAHRNFVENERRLIDYCAQRWTKVRSEYFRGADFEEVVLFAGTDLAFEGSSGEFPYIREFLPDRSHPFDVHRLSFEPDANVVDDPWLEEGFIKQGGGIAYPRIWFSPAALRRFDAAREERRLRGEAA